jgi:hypothetical protein
MKDLDSLPFPTYFAFDRKRYAPLISVLTSRGCPFQCIYCPVQLAIGRRFVARSPESVVRVEPGIAIARVDPWAYIRYQPASRWFVAVTSIVSFSWWTWISRQPFTSA